MFVVLDTRGVAVLCPLSARVLASCVCTVLPALRAVASACGRLVGLREARAGAWSGPRAVAGGLAPQGDLMLGVGAMCARHIRTLELGLSGPAGVGCVDVVCVTIVCLVSAAMLELRINWLFMRLRLLLAGVLTPCDCMVLPALRAVSSACRRPAGFRGACVGARGVLRAVAGGRVPQGGPVLGVGVARRGWMALRFALGLAWWDILMWK